MHFFGIVTTTRMDVVVHLVWWLWCGDPDRLWGASGCPSRTSSVLPFLTWSTTHRSLVQLLILTAAIVAYTSKAHWSGSPPMGPKGEP